MTPREVEPRANKLPRSAVITLGGNAILPARGTGTFEEQLAMPTTLQRPYVESLDAGVPTPGQADRMQAWFANASPPADREK